MDKQIQILHLEDSLKDAELIRELLLNSDFDLVIDYAASEMDFVSMLRKKRYDLILADFKLPGFDAFGALQRVLEICPNVPLICVSGTIGEEAAVGLIRQGAVDYVIKDRLGRLPTAILRALEDAEKRIALKKAEDALRQSEEKYRGIFENIQDVYYETKVDGTILEISPSVQTLFKDQYHRQDLIGQKIDILYGDIEDRKALLSELSDNGRVTDYEITFKNRDGSTIFCSVISKLVTSRQNEKIIIGSIRDMTERKQAEALIKKNLDEKEFLLRELYHRTKNNMQVILSMLDLKAFRSQDQAVRDVLREMENKIQSMALVHKKLYDSKNLSTLNLKVYFEELLTLIKKNCQIDETQIRIDYQAVDTPVLIDTAIPLGLALNELMSNIAKHAFPDKRKGKVSISLRRDSNQGLVIKVKDNGIGLPIGFDLEKDCGLGLETVIQLIQYQLGGEIEWINLNGLTCRISIAEEVYEPRV